MKERLDQLTLKDLIEISCGEFAVLAVGDEEPTLDGFRRAAVRIIAEYKSIASPAQYRMDVSAAEKLAKLRLPWRCAVQTTSTWREVCCWSTALRQSS